ncbi:MAG: sigma-70 family RNA polymerase sigma factor [Oscillospiraceae bacterium]|nr:sigma-70 family RNA polymerase sigma factor [Oscillospiraceae bacterium]
MDYNPENNMIEKYADLIYKICMTKLYNYDKSSISDACQDVFLKYLKSAPKFKDENHEKSWFIRTSINCCTDIYRKQKYKSSHEYQEEDFDITQIIYEFNDELDEINGSLYEILALLPEKIKYAVYLFYIEEYKTEEIAKILKTSNAAIRMRLKRGREILRDKLISQKKIVIEEEMLNV